MTEPAKKIENKKPVKLTAFGKVFEKRSKEWEENPLLFEKDGMKFIEKNAGKHIEALRAFVQICLQAGNPFACNDKIIEYIRTHDEVKEVFEFYFNLYTHFSDTPDEAIWAGNLLNEIQDDNVILLKMLIGLYGQKEMKEKQIELFLKVKEKYPDQVNEIEEMTTYLYSELPEYIEKGKELIKNFDIEKVDPATAVNIGSMKFYSGLNKDGLIYHFGGEDFRPKDFVSKKEIPNHQKADFNGKSIVITPYRGMGDSMILSRFIPKFLEKWPEAKITVATEKSMIPLYKNMPGIKGVGTLESYAGKMFDHCLGVNMLSRYLREILVDEEGRTLYHDWVTYDPSYDEKWAPIVNKDSTKTLVGINWKGSQRLGGGGKSDKNTSRDLELSDFIHIIDTYPQFNYMVLNNDISDEERETLSKYSNVLIPEKIKDFGDTAALIKLCDVVVSIDTSVSTLSASMSKDTIVLAKFWPDYRWLYYEKWWDLTKFNVQVFRKDRYNAGWVYPVCKTIQALKAYEKN